MTRNARGRLVWERQSGGDYRAGTGYGFARIQYSRKRKRWYLVDEGGFPYRNWRVVSDHSTRKAAEDAANRHWPG